MRVVWQSSLAVLDLLVDDVLGSPASGVHMAIPGLHLALSDGVGCSKHVVGVKDDVACILHAVVLDFEPGDGWKPSVSAHRRGVVTSYSFAAAPAPSWGTTGTVFLHNPPIAAGAVWYGCGIWAREYGGGPGGGGSYML
jgi:hypothetical protein